MTRVKKGVNALKNRRNTLKSNGTSYSKFIHALKTKKIDLDRKVLAGLAQNNPETFTRLLQKVS